MTMDNKINQILQDLYALDPRFREHESELRGIVTGLLRAEPDTKFDSAFAESLRQKLLARASIMEDRKSSRSVWLSRLPMVFAGTAAIVLAVVGITYRNRPDTPQPAAIGQLFSSKMQVQKLESKAFGSLAASAAGATGAGGMGGGGAGGAPERSSASAVPDQPVAGKGGGGDMGIMPAFNIKYSYVGEPLKLEQKDVTVYERVKGFNSGVDMAGFIRQLNVGLLDSGSFTNTEMSMLTINENRDYGYTMNINMQDGVVDVYQNWQKWPMPGQECRTQECYDSYRLKESDVPDDQFLIATANQFLADHGISTESYGQPYVEDFWRRQYETFADKSQVYIPDMISVIYPLKIDGQEVVDAGGNKTGLMVSVNIRYRKASGVSQLANQRYNSSTYEAEQDSQKILDYVQNPYGTREGFVPAPNTVTQTVELGTPTMGYEKVWDTDGKGGTRELIVPALLFPVTKAPKEYYQTHVVVPLVKEMVEQRSYLPLG